MYYQSKFSHWFHIETEDVESLFKVGGVRIAYGNTACINVNGRFQLSCCIYLTTVDIEKQIDNKILIT